MLSLPLLFRGSFFIAAGYSKEFLSGTYILGEHWYDGWRIVRDVVYHIVVHIFPLTVQLASLVFGHIRRKKELITKERSASSSQKS